MLRIIKKIKSIFIKLDAVDVKLEKIYQSNLNSYSYSILQATLPLDKYLGLTPWSISPSALLHIANYISIYRPSRIVEFGSGVTTLYISKLIETNQIDCEFYSVEHDSDWIDIVGSSLSNNCKVNFVQADLVERLSFRGLEFNWYEFAKLDAAFDRGSIDFFIVDAPPSNPYYTRAGAFIYFDQQVKKESIVYLLDDTNRDGERELINYYGSNIKVYNDYSFGGKKLLYDASPITLKK